MSASAEKKELILNSLERLIFANIFPKQDTMINMLLQKGLVDKAKLSPDDINAIELKQEGGGVKGKWGAVMPMSVDVNICEEKYMNDAVDKLDKERAITAELLTICQKIKSL